MKPITLMIVLAAAILMAAGCTPPAPNTEQMIAAAKEVDQRFIDAYNAGDVDGVMALYLNSPDLVSFPVGGEVMIKGYDAMKTNLMKEFAQMKGAKLEISDAHYEAAGNLVVTWGLWHWSGPMPDGTPMEMDGRFTDVKKEHDGKWVYIMDHPSAPLPPPPAPAQ